MIPSESGASGVGFASSPHRVSVSRVSGVGLWIGIEPSERMNEPYPCRANMAHIRQSMAYMRQSMVYIRQS